MKIGIITQPLHTNYGGLLQNYALQQILERLGHEVITIDQHNLRPKEWRIYASKLKTFFVKLYSKESKRIYPYCLNKYQELYIRQYTDNFISKYIRHSDKMNTKDDFLDFSKTFGVDALIVGSDQVWRPKYNIDVLRSFFNFAVDLKIKRIAYAASFGVDEWEFSEKQTLQCRKLIRLFDAVSVREKSGVSLCQTHLKCKATCVLDPTMLLDSNDYVNLLQLENEVKSNGNLFTYILDKSEIKENIINKISTELGLHPFSVMPNGVNTETIKDIDSCVYPSPTKWVRAFMDAEFVVCDSFHGVVFSILFNKPFIVIGNSKRGMTRFISLLEMFSLENRLVQDLSDLSVIGEIIDWKTINQTMNNWRLKSLSFLTDKL